MKVESNFGRDAILGWWWGVWQDGRLVGFGAGYRGKRRAFRHEADCARAAGKGLMPTVACRNPIISRRAS